VAAKDKPISAVGGRRPGGTSPTEQRVINRKDFIAKADEEILGPKQDRQLLRRTGGPAAGGNVARRSLNNFRTRQANAGSQSDEFMDLLNSIFNGGGGGGGGRGGRGGSVRSFSDAQIADTQARLQAIYGRYADDIAAQEAAIGQTYDTAGTALGGIYDTSVGNINKAYDAARAAQTQQLLNLGMTEQTPVQSFGNQTAATTSLQNLRAAVLAQNEATRKASITNQRLSAEAARRQGTETVAQAVAQMQSAMTPVSGGGGGGGGGGLNANQYASLMLQRMKMNQDAEIQAAKMANSSQPRATPDINALISQAKEQGMSDSDALAYARLF
jgi:hypothetical protein